LHASKLQKEFEMSDLRKAALSLVIASLCLACQARADDGDSLDNPKPLADDVSLPMPCGGEMVLRYVYILAQGSLDDREVSLGYPFNEDEAGYKQSFISGYRRDFINGQFTLADLSGDWSKTIGPLLPKTDKGTPLKPMMYFIGKYEVTARQYAQVMAQAQSLASGEPAPACEAPEGMAGRLPKVKLSRFEAERFAAVYSADEKPSRAVAGQWPWQQCRRRRHRVCQAAHRGGVGVRRSGRPGRQPSGS
jgi:hypothetical protein